ncbi:TetR family transcriptional regulator [Pukyongiella litopenaei]|uniref:TetR/AcrR family transcriptional regulator n=1 Tax=Pukyongiella litopenaei TaxID=2605946 RepID=A0A2S0MRI5_9RHOB|nr:TetR family transcriptional regulator [Pukyongiella litopenaei]AVO38456.1 TetR/AcrR family transcriptional regulator [Pukyongiella litopenaei]
MVRYATGAEDKAARQQDILTAALDLYLQDTRRLPSVAAIAARAGLAKGTVYLYFDSKEQIFVTLQVREWRAFIDRVNRFFRSAPGTPEQKVAGFIAQLAGHIVANPSLMRLDSMGYALLAPNLSDDRLLEFKLRFAEILENTGHAVEEALALPSGKGVGLLIASFALTRGLWQIADLPATVRSAPDFAPHPFARLELGPDLLRALTDYWRGAWRAFPAPEAPDPAGFA